MAKRRIFTAPSAQVVEISTGTARLEKVAGEPDSYVLHVNDVPSSSITLSDPARLDFEYLDWMARIIEATLPEGTVRAIHIGAAGCALARALDARRPGSRQTAIDIDPLLIDYVRTWFDLPRSPALALRAGDGAEEIAGFRDDTADVIVRDAFSRDSVPTALQTTEFYAECARVLKPGGLFLANVPDSGDHRVLRDELDAAASAFPHLAAASESGVLKGRRRGNVVVAGSAQPLPDAALDRVLRTAPTMAAWLTGETLAARLGR
ncbi:fused MFS/spermidine synthase [Brevibacterium sp. W7.2]|uniref:spermidine synthase n=1 Tax=Brevibacterium sp. W7.2 TaxID=2823518 RepID=UPI001BADC9CF|nr:fused MFS/spermidine synthase [Brevibacterium sp. W7.2]